MLSQTCKTAIKAVVFLSFKSEDGERATALEISECINASEHTVGKALQKLAKCSIINSVKGPNGGFYLTDKQQSQPIYNIVEAIEGPEVFYECGLGLSKCSEKHPCPIHNDYSVVRELIENIFRTQKVRDLREKVSDGEAFLMD